MDIPEETALNDSISSPNIFSNMNTIISLLSLDLQKNIQISMSVLRQALDKYGFGGISISFNGGKDALVMLILYFYTLRQYSSEKEGIKMKRIPAIYIQNPYPFSEIEYFVKKCSENYVLDLVYKKSPMKTALKEYLDEYPEIKAVLVGSRRSDLYKSSSNY